jgi:hypothetical protein
MIRFIVVILSLVLGTVSLLGTVLLPGAASAQEVTTPDITALRQEAFQLTLESKLSELPADLQTQARDLLSRAEVLHEPILAMRERMLEAYIAELEAGKQPYLARAIARNAIAEERLALLPEVVPLIKDIRAFVRNNPEVAPLFKDLRENFRENGLQNFR